MSLRIGIVGYGEIAQYHARHLVAAGATIAGVVTTRAIAPGATRYPTLAAMLPAVDAVCIAVPNYRHAALCLEALHAGRPVFVEKPLCTTAAELDELRVALPRARTPVHVGLRLRCNPMLRALRERVKGPRRIRCTYRLGIERLAAGKAWTRRAAESGGAFFTLGVHALDVARWLAGARGAALEDLTATASGWTPAADFPLRVALRGTLAGGTVIEAGADLSGDAPFRLELALDAAGGRYPDASLSRPAPEDEGAADAEYAGLMADFVRAAEGRVAGHANALWPARTQSGGSHRGLVAPAAIDEILQLHDDLLRARALTDP